MRRALLLAARGRGQTSPNPMVGATVIAPDGTIIGDGWHQRAGTPHAEVHALEMAGPRARGATLICTLEPCCHHGRTGPCVERIVDAGVAHVVAAIGDPNPRVAGGGFRYLAAHGVRVTTGVEADAASRLNAAFLRHVRDGRPWVILKAGVSLDGYVAQAAGVRTEITSPESRLAVQRLRAEVDAVAVGVDTVVADDPVLTARDVVRARPLTRVVFDRRLRTPASARLLRTLESGPVVIVTTEAALSERAGAASALAAAGARLEATDGSFGAALLRLGERGIQSLLLEGGARIHQAAAYAGMIDEVRLFIAPEPLGQGGVPFGGEGLSVAALNGMRTRLIGPDVLVTGYVHRPH